MLHWWCVVVAGWLGCMLLVWGLVPEAAKPLPRGSGTDWCLLSPATTARPQPAPSQVCAVSLVGQWIAEAEAKLGGSLRMHMCELAGGCTVAQGIGLMRRRAGRGRGGGGWGRGSAR